MIKSVEIKDLWGNYGEFKIKHDYLHRERSRLVTFEAFRFKEIQFNYYDPNIGNYSLKDGFQKGYDRYGNEIEIKVLTKT